MDVGLVLSRWLRLVWASYMSAIAGSLLIGSWQLSKSAKKNSWQPVEFRGKLENGRITGSVVWKGKLYNLSWLGETVPNKVQVLESGNQPLEIRTGQLTRAEEQRIVRRMLLLAVVVIAITWFITMYTFKHRFLIRI